jgi:hypothetical protein
MKRRLLIVPLVVVAGAGALSAVAVTSGSDTPTEGQTLCVNPGTWKNYPHKPPENITPPSVYVC